MMNSTTYEGSWSSASRQAYHKEHPENFAGPDMSFPIRDANDVHDAWNLAGHAANPDAVRSRIKSIAKRLGLSHALPDTAKAGAKEEYINQDIPDSSTTIARIQTCWLEDEAISLNGRQYPKEAVDALIRSAQIDLSSQDALPITCYISHDKADSDSTLDIAGKIVKVWREGRKAYAAIDIPNTQTGRDVATLVKGGYIKSQSLRASNAEIYPDREHTFPQVRGAELHLDGIDFTTSPGLSKVARIKSIDIVSESADMTKVSRIDEVFNADKTSVVLLKEYRNMETQQHKVKEETLEPMTHGNTPGMTGSQTCDDYSMRMYKEAPAAPRDQFPQRLQDVHDRVAYVAGLECAPTTIEAIQKFGIGIIEEAGASLSKTNKKHLMKAHKSVAEHMSMPCASMSTPLTGGDGDNDDDDMDAMGPKYSGTAMVKVSNDKADDRNLTTPESQKKDKTMDLQEAIRTLQEAKYDIVAPKTKEQLLQEELEQKLAEQKKQLEEQQATLMAKLEEMNAKIAESANPFARAQQATRKSIVEGAKTTEDQKRPYYRNGDYIREQLRDVSFREQLLDRSRPLPDSINAEHLLKELQLELLGMYDATYGLTGNPRIVAL